MQLQKRAAVDLIAPPKGVAVVCALMFLSLGTWELFEAMLGPIAIGLGVLGVLLCLAGAVFLARASSPIEREEPRVFAHFLMLGSILWSLGLLYASVWLGTFEIEWRGFFFLTAPVFGVAWTYVIGKLVMNRRRILVPQSSYGPRGAANTWLSAATVFSSALALVSMRESLSGPMDIAFAVLWMAPPVVCMYITARILLRELPVAVQETAGLSRLRATTVWSLRVWSGTVAVFLCASCRPLDGVQAAQFLVFAGLAVIGGVHLALETVIRELPRGARTVWFGSMAAVCAAIAVTLVTFRLPRRALFELFRSRFDACVADSMEGERSIGPWGVLVKRDPGGGVFLETFSKQIDSDGELHVGFAHGPVGDTTPFGRLTDRRVLGGDWYEFEVREASD